MAERQSDDLMADRASEALYAALKSGSLRGGQFISVPQLVDMLDFPIAAVRDAVKQAGSFGLLDSLPKRGVQVMGTGPEVTRDCLDVRAMLDKEGARRLIGSGKRPDMGAKREAHMTMRDLAGQKAVENVSPRAIETDLSLHDFLSTGLGNPVADRVYAVNRIRIAIIQNSRPFVRNRIVSAMTEHIEIIDALEAGDAGRATRAIETHLESTLEWWGVR